MAEVRDHQFFSLVDWQRMLDKDYRPPMVPALASELDLRYFSPSFTAEPPTLDWGGQSLGGGGGGGGGGSAIGVGSGRISKRISLRASQYSRIASRTEPASSPALAN